MKIILYIVIGLVALIILFFGGAFIYIKYFDDITPAEIQLTPDELFDDTVLTYISEIADELRNGTRVSMAVTIQDSIYYYGVKRSADIVTVDNNASAVFEIGSITKVMTAYVIHSLVEEGKLGLDDFIVEHLPISNHNLDSITIRSLIKHTSGLSRLPDNLELLFNDNPYKDYTRQDLYEYLESIDQKVIESDQKYSNLGYGVLGAIAQESSGKAMSVLYKELIFDPLGMDNSSFHLDSVSHVVSPGKGSLDSPSHFWNFDILGAAGAVKSSADQMVLFLQHLMEEDEICRMMRIESFVNSETSATGLGLFINKKEKDALYWHNGATGGFNSCMIYEPMSKSGIVMLTNRSLGAKLDNKIDHLAFKIFRHLQTQNK